MSSVTQGVIKHKMSLLNLAAELGNVSRACKVMGFSRDTFYRYKSAVEAGGLEALLEANRKKPNPKNRVDQVVEEAVLAFSLEQPAYGRARVSNELRKTGIFISPSGVRSIWLRHGRESFKRRLAALEKHVAETGAVLTESQVQALEKKQDDDLAYGCQRRCNTDPLGVRPVYGYLRQKPDLQKTLPEEYWAESWDNLCDRQFELVQHLAQAYKGETEPSRDSFAPIRHIIHLPQPMDAIADMIQRMRADRPVGNPRREATWARDLFLVMLLVSNPLRRRTMAHLTWRADNSGELYQRPDESWWIRIPRRMFKNTAGAAGDRDYDCQVHPKVWPMLEQYLFVHRPKLMQHPTDLVFLARQSHGITEHRPWGDLSKRVNILTAKYLPRCAGTGAHAFRHIVATSILKADGGDYKTAALVLNNRPTTVEKHYAGLRSNDGAERMAKLLEGPLSRM